VTTIDASDAMPGIDAGDGGQAAVDAGPREPVFAGDGNSRCQVSAESVVCEHQIQSIVAGPTIIRDVYWQSPLGEAPPGGWPAVVIYQGSFFGPAITWGTLTPAMPFGGFEQGLLQALLLDNGFTVIAPSAAAGLAWQTNAGAYELSTDHIFITRLLEEIEAGTFGPVDMQKLYATGVSSGGYMTSRMAVTYPGRFRALAIQSGSYATCLGPVCNVPGDLPSDHPPTLLLHGSADVVVPVATAEAYHQALVEQGFESEIIVQDGAGHGWLDISPVEITRWFLEH